MDYSNIIKLDDPVMFLKVAVKSLNNGDYENAIKRCLRAIELSFKRGYKGVDSSLLGLIYLRSGNYKEATDSFYRALAYGNRQSFLKVHLMLVQCFISDGNLKEADDYVKFLFDCRLIDEETKNMIIENYSAVIEDSKREMEASAICLPNLVKDVVEYVNNKNFDIASELLLRAMEIAPNDVIINYLYENIDEAFSGELNYPVELPESEIAKKITLLENINSENVEEFVKDGKLGVNLHFAMEYGNLPLINKLFDTIFDYGVDNRLSYILEDLLFLGVNDKFKLLLLRKLTERKHIQRHSIRCGNRLKVIYPIYFNGNERLYYEPVLNAVEYLCKNRKIVSIDLLYVLNYLDEHMNSENVKYLEDKDTCQRLIIYKYLFDLGLKFPQSYMSESLLEAVKLFKIEEKKEAIISESLPENVILFKKKD